MLQLIIVFSLVQPGGVNAQCECETHHRKIPASRNVPEQGVIFPGSAEKRSPTTEVIMANYKLAETLLITPFKGEMHGFNYLQRKEFLGDSNIADFLFNFDNSNELNPENPSVANLEENGLLINENSVEYICEKNFLDQWEWGVAAAAYHFSLLDRKNLSLEENTARQLRRIVDDPPPPAFLRNNAFETEISLQRPVTELVEIMRKRRTVRDVEPIPVPLSVISEILYSGMAIVGFANNGVCDVPLSMTPSGGAKNPYEAFLIARDVDGLEPGIYHYSALDHTLGMVHSNVPERLGDLIGGQDWADNMPCMIILCAFLERPMWKYDDPNGYRVVLIEAGHIGQNMMLAGTHRGFTVCPTGVISHSIVSDLLSLENIILHTPIYSLSVGRPKFDSADNNWRAI